MMQADVYGFHHYLVQRDFLHFWNHKFRIYEPSGALVLYSEMKALKLKESIKIYSDEQNPRELLSIQARQIIDFRAPYDVTDSVTGQKLGALRRKGLKSVFRDEWLILDAADQEFGKIEEDSMGLALVRRFLTNLLPQSYTVTVNGQAIIEFKQNFNPFMFKLSLDFSRDPGFMLDRRLGIAAALLLCSIPP